MRKNIFFNELTTEVQARILDSFGADNATELGLDVNPYAVAVYDKEGNVEALEMFEPAIQSCFTYMLF